jgi:hypothetical protein
MRRRHLLGFLAIAAAAPRVAFADVRTISLDKAFPYLAAYLQMPVAERSHFYLAFRAYRNKRPVGDVAAAIVAANGARTPIAFDRQGIVTRVPDLATLRGGGHVEIASNCGAPRRPPFASTFRSWPSRWLRSTTRSSSSPARSAW